MAANVTSWSMISSDLPSPAEASFSTAGPSKRFAQAGNRFTLFGIMLYTRTSIAWRSPSLTRLKDSEVMKIASPGSAQT